MLLFQKYEIINYVFNNFSLDFEFNKDIIIKIITNAEPKSNHIRIKMKDLVFLNNNINSKEKYVTLKNLENEKTKKYFVK